MKEEKASEPNSLASRFKSAHDALGKFMTIGGKLLTIFMLTAAAGPAAAAITDPTLGVNNLDVLLSFWSGIWTDPITGEQGVAEMANRLAMGAGAYGGAFYDIGSGLVNGIQYGDFGGALNDALYDPLAKIA